MRRRRLDAELAQRESLPCCLEAERAERSEAERGRTEGSQATGWTVPKNLTGSEGRPTKSGRLWNCGLTDDMLSKSR